MLAVVPHGCRVGEKWDQRRCGTDPGMCATTGIEFRAIAHKDVVSWASKSSLETEELESADRPTRSVIQNANLARAVCER
jgi:hypothetical protein